LSAYRRPTHNGWRGKEKKKKGIRKRKERGEKERKR